ncbi:MAG: hypothetical protein RQ752_01095 [Thermohalobaculum sp.]|nr:hypothetical protein [Thermohalobaculum sp.]
MTQGGAEQGAGGATRLQVASRGAAGRIVPAPFQGGHAEGPADSDLAARRADLAGGFAVLMASCSGLRRAVRSSPAAARLGRPLGHLAVALQAADSTDQRLAHLEAAAARRAGLDDLARHAANRVIARQTAALAEAVTATATALTREIDAIERLAADGPDGGLADCLAALRVDVAGLARAAGGLGALAWELDAAPGAQTPAAVLATVDLGWMQALYTMDAEREVHARAFV